MGFLTTHVLDTANGCPAQGIKIQLFTLPDHVLVCEVVSNEDGRVDEPLLSDDGFIKGRYELVFHTQDYFEKSGLSLDTPAFIDDVVIRFGIAKQDEHYHVPLLVSPWSYSTYRGS